MATNYPGDPNATEAPSGAPEDDAGPIVVLPADGDPPNAATFAQAFMVLADFVAWLKKPFAKASAWAQAIVVYLNALESPRFLVDHMGFAGGDIQKWNETWSGSEINNAAGTVAFTATRQRWSTFIVAGGEISVHLPDTTTWFTRFVKVSYGTGGGTISAHLQGEVFASFVDGLGIALDFDLRTATAIDQMYCSAGLANPDAATDIPLNGFIGGCFKKASGNANWMFVTGDGSNLSTPVDTGIPVAASTHYKMRVEWLGATGAADDAVAAMRGYINGALVATSTAHLPSAAGAAGVAGAFFTIGNDTGGIAARQFTVGNVRGSSNY